MWTTNTINHIFRFNLNIIERARYFELRPKSINHDSQNEATVLKHLIEDRLIFPLKEIVVVGSRFKNFYYFFWNFVIIFIIYIYKKFRSVFMWDVIIEKYNYYFYQLSLLLIKNKISRPDRNIKLEPGFLNFLLLLENLYKLKFIEKECKVLLYEQNLLDLYLYTNIF